MSPPRHNRTRPTHSGEAAPPRGPASPEELAHELSNLLDGGLRNVGLVIQRLTPAPAPGIAPGTAPADAPPNLTDGVLATPDDLARLETTNHAMRQMAALIRQWMQERTTNGAATPPATPVPHAPLQTLGQTIEHAVRLHIPAAMSRQVDIRVRLDGRASALPGGPVYTVIVNALRNAIEAFDHRLADTGDPPVIDVEARVEDGFVEVFIRDNGPGLHPAVLDPASRFRFGVTTKPTSAPAPGNVNGNGGPSAAHGLGLPLARQIAHCLGGTVALRNRVGRGAELILSYPVRSVLRTEAL